MPLKKIIWNDWLWVCVSESVLWKGCIPLKPMDLRNLTVLGAGPHLAAGHTWGRSTLRNMSHFQQFTLGSRSHFQQVTPGADLDLLVYLTGYTRYFGIAGLSCKACHVRILLRQEN